LFKILSRSKETKLKHLYAFICHVVDETFQDEGDDITMKYERFYSKCKLKKPQKYPWNDRWPRELINAVKASYGRVCLPVENKSPYDFSSKSELEDVEDEEDVEDVEDVVDEAHLFGLIVDVFCSKIEGIFEDRDIDVEQLKYKAHRLYGGDNKACADIKDWLQLFDIEYDIKEKKAKKLAENLVNRIEWACMDPLQVGKKIKANIALFLLLKWKCDDPMCDPPAGTKSKIELLPYIDKCF